MTKSELIEALRRLTPKDLADVVLDATAQMDPHGEPSPMRWVIGVADPEDHHVSIVCRPEEKWADDSPLCQFGEHAGLETVSWAKNAICPVCGNDVYGT
jgi:hypothetical protein